MVWIRSAPQGYESLKVAAFIVPYTRGKGIDVGCGPKKPFPHFIGIDDCTDYGERVPGVDIMADCTKPLFFADGSLDFVFSSHFLEHVEDHKAVLTDWWRVLRPGGHLVLYLPHADHYPRKDQPGANPDHKHDFVPRDIAGAMEEVCKASGTGYVLLEDETRIEQDEYSFLQVFGKKAEPGLVFAPWKRREKSALVVRYGGIGDQMMVSAILPGLKAQGFHVTFNTTPSGMEWLKEDPNIDEWLIQDKDQVPNETLSQYFFALSTRYDRFVNFSESVEGSLLMLPHRPPYYWSDHARRAAFSGVNYAERHCDLAGVSHTWVKPRFYPTKNEVEWTKMVRDDIGDRPVVLWSLAGSSVHKRYPWMDTVLARLMTDSDAAVVLCGDLSCRLLESGWEKEERIVKTCGKWSIRETLAFAQIADCVVGPETGVLNAVAAENVPKVVMLSHSSETNLTKHWKCTRVLTADVPCFPCHRMHYDTDFCPQTEIPTGEGEPAKAAACAAGISADVLTDAILRQLRRAKPWRRAA